MIFEIIKFVYIILKYTAVIGNTIICAEIVIERILANFSFIYLLKNFDIGVFNKTIPRVPR